MEALVFKENRLIYTKNHEKPIPKKGESLIKVLISAICNTDREVIKGYKPNFSGVLGHEFVGVVKESEDTYLVGKKVVGELNLGCKNCIYCKTGREKHCVNRRVLGLEGMDGSFGEYIVLSNELLHVLPSCILDEKAIYVEPLAAAFEIIESTHIKPSFEVAVLGDGRLAHLIAQVVSLNGADITVFGKSEKKLEKFIEFSRTSVNPEGSFDVVIEASGSPLGIETAINLVRSGGTVVVKSTFSSNASIDLSQIVVREIKLQGSRCGPFKPAIKIIEQDKINLSEISLFRLEDYEEAFASEDFKVGFDFR